jgi:hypothetical protein
MAQQPAAQVSAFLAQAWPENPVEQLKVQLLPGSADIGTVNAATRRTIAKSSLVFTQRFPFKRDRGGLCCKPGLTGGGAGFP